MGDALNIVLLEMREFTKEDFGRLHPGGAIGRALTLKLTDIMRSDATHKLVKVLPEMTIKDTIIEMTKAHSGSAMVVDKDQTLLGIFTDGDLRRHFDDNLLLEKSGGKYMTKNPVTIYGDQMAVDALKAIEKYKIDDVVVVDRNNKVLGVVDSQDLPGFKLM